MGKFSIRRALSSALLALIALMLFGVTFVSADNITTSTITATIAPGLLSATVAPAVAFTAEPGTVGTYSLPISVSNLTGGATGWHLTITSTPFTGTGGTLPTTASTITSLTAVCTVAGTCSSNTLVNGTATLPAVPAGTPAPGPTAVTFFSTGAAPGTGIYTVTPTISVTIPATTGTGVYISAVSIGSVTGP